VYRFAVLVHDRVQAQVVLTLEGLDLLGVLLQVDRIQAEPLISKLLCQLLQTRHFGFAGLAPGGPKVHQYDLAAIGAEVRFSAADHWQGDLRRRGAWSGRPAWRRLGGLQEREPHASPNGDHHQRSEPNCDTTRYAVHLKASLASQPGVTGTLSGVISESLASALLAAQGDEREQLVRSADAASLTDALTTLGHTRDAKAAAVLALIDNVADDRAVRKAARRELHRLRSMGVEMPSPGPAQTAAEAPPMRRSAVLEVTEAWATDIDPTGSRALWLLAERPLGGVWFAAVLLNDQRGLPELSLVDTTRKRFQRDFEASRRDAGTWVRLPGDYSLRLVREAVELTREVGGGLPTRYQAFRDVFGEAAGAPERALVYESISPVEINFNPGWLDESPRLLGEPELGGWYVPMPAELRSRTLDVARASSAGLLVPGHTPEQQVGQLLADVAHQVLTSRPRRAFRRRLEETGYIFLQTERLSAARLAVAAARALDEGGVPAERHPLMRRLLATGLARLAGGEIVGGHRASEALLELVERASQYEAQTGPVETRPSGLILPR
jgi:hypothetical protein